MADTLKLYWAWRKRADRPFLRSISLVLVAFVFKTATIAASIFSSLIVDSGSITVLVESSLCGGVSSEGYARKTYTVALNQAVPVYARDCYKNGSLPLTCGVFMRPNVPVTIEDAPCPFNASMCESSAFSMDSGLVDIGGAFGLNLEAKDRINYRRKATCTVLPIEGHMEIKNSTELPAEYFSGRGLINDEQLVVLDYGPTNDPSQVGSIIASLLASNLSGNPKFNGGRNFYTNLNNSEGSGMFPIQEMRNPAGDTMFKTFMSMATSYNTPIDDPLFAAHKEMIEYDDIQRKNFTIYHADYPMRAVGCLQQHQYCHTRNGQDDSCTPFAGKQFYENMTTIFPEANELQQALLRLLIFSSCLRDISKATSCKANSILNRADDAVRALPDTWWQEELAMHEYETWTSMQILVSQYAIGPKTTDSQADNYYIKPRTSGEKALCKARKMRKSGEFVNINVFGLAFILSFSIFLAILEITLLKFLVFLTRFRRSIGPRIDRWIQDGIWQLQRRAYEGEGHRNWTDLEADIPLMEKGQKLKDLPIMWLPGKSPAMMQTNTFGSQTSVESQRPLRGETHLQDGDDAQSMENEGKRWYNFPRRQRD